MMKENLENLTLTGRIKGTRSRGRQTGILEKREQVDGRRDTNRGESNERTEHTAGNKEQGVVENHDCRHPQWIWYLKKKNH